jgi:hypothetical protein
MNNLHTIEFSSIQMVTFKKAFKINTNLSQSELHFDLYKLGRRFNKEIAVSIFRDTIIFPILIFVIILIAVNYITAPVSLPIKIAMMGAVVGYIWWKKRNKNTIFGTRNTIIAYAALIALSFALAYSIQTIPQNDNSEIISQIVPQDFGESEYTLGGTDLHIINPMMLLEFRFNVTAIESERESYRLYILQEITEMLYQTVYEQLSTQGFKGYFSITPETTDFEFLHRNFNMPQLFLFTVTYKKDGEDERTVSSCRANLYLNFTERAE